MKIIFTLRTVVTLALLSYLFWYFTDRPIPNFETLRRRSSPDHTAPVVQTSELTIEDVYYPKENVGDKPIFQRNVVVDRVGWTQPVYITIEIRENFKPRDYQARIFDIAIYQRMGLQLQLYRYLAVISPQRWSLYRVARDDLQEVFWNSNSRLWVYIEEALNRSPDFALEDPLLERI